LWGARNWRPAEDLVALGGTLVTFQGEVVRQHSMYGLAAAPTKRWKAWRAPFLISGVTPKLIEDWNQNA
jgi:hypothetical protein|tara:strand:- start:918 stop:1124 length:207 start_codon:yes stop_codon:yes gene_type:complete